MVSYVNKANKLSFNFRTTAEIPVPKSLIDQIIGQDYAVNIIKKAARQRRHALLIGLPGTGKSMLAQAMAELMPATSLEDILVYPNPTDENNPKVRIVKTYPSSSEIEKDIELKRISQMDHSADGMGRKIIKNYNKIQSTMGITEFKKINPLMTALLVAILGIIVVFFLPFSDMTKWMSLAIIGGSFLLYGLFTYLYNIGTRLGINPNFSSKPKLIVDNTGRKTAPFIDATGAKAGALLGDVRHDPLQSGGLGTPAHLRVEAGAIHKANKGVLFIDEIVSLTSHFQQELLTAMQEKKYPITGQSEHSSGAIVKTEPVPCDFVLVAAGNFEDIPKMHPALRSRIRGAGYEIKVNDNMPDTKENRLKIVQFVAQEVKKDGRIPHFTKDAVLEIIEEAKKRATRKHSLTLNLRGLGGLIRAAGDVAIDKGAPYVTVEHINKALILSRTLEEQVAHEFVTLKKDYSVVQSLGYAIGKVNGLAVFGDRRTGIVLPIEAEVTPAASKEEGKIIATGKLGEIAKEAVMNVSAIVKKYAGKTISNKDVHIQFLQSYEGVEGDSASISIAVAMISAMENIPVDQSVAMTGSLSIRGEVMPVGGLTGKVEAAIDAGCKTVIVPISNKDDVYLSDYDKNKIKIVPVYTIVDVLKIALKDSPKKVKLLKVLSGITEEILSSKMYEIEKTKTTKKKTTKITSRKKQKTASSKTNKHTTKKKKNNKVRRKRTTKNSKKTKK